MAGIVIRGLAWGAKALFGGATRAAPRVAAAAEGAAVRTAAGTTARVAATETAGVAATATARRGIVSSFLGSSTTRGQALALGTMTAMAPWLYSKVDASVDGDISRWIGETTVSAITNISDEALAAMSDEQKRTWVMETADAAIATKDFFSADLDPALYNAAIAETWEASGHDPDVTKEAAIAWHLKNPALITATLALRSKLLEKAYPDKTPEERNEMLAEDFVNGLLKKANECAELKGKGPNGTDLVVTKDDIAKLIEKHQEALSKAPGFSRMVPGLTRIFPQLTGKLQSDGPDLPVAAVAPVVAPTVSSVVSGATDRARDAVGSAVDAGRETVEQSTGLRAVFGWVVDLLEAVTHAFDILFKGLTPSNYFNQTASNGSPAPRIANAPVAPGGPDLGEPT